jgi:hypothetical protein
VKVRNRGQNKGPKVYGRTHILDHGTANPIVARLGVQIFEILDHCEITPEARDGIRVIYMNSLAKKLLRCWEIVEQYRLEFTKQIGAYTPPPADAQVVEMPHVLRLEEGCHNFLYEAKNFIRDLLKAFNVLYGTKFVQASEYLWPKKGKGNQSLLEFARLTFGPEDARTKLVKDFFPTVERVVGYRNAVEHEGERSGALRIENFRFQPGGKLLEPCWWIEKDGKATAKTSIRADLCGIIETLLILAEDIFVSWADKHLRAPQHTQIYFVPEGERDAAQPVKYEVNATQELVDKIAKLEADRQRGEV